MQFKIEFKEGTEDSLRREYARFIFDEIKKEIFYKVSKYKEKYEKRLDYVNEKFEKEFTFDDIRDIMTNSLEIVSVKGAYMIRLDRSRKVKGLLTSTLVKVFEYGIPGYLIELPTIRRIIVKYRAEYHNMYFQFMERKFGIL